MEDEHNVGVDHNKVSQHTQDRPDADDAFAICCRAGNGLCR